MRPAEVNVSRYDRVMECNFEGVGAARSHAIQSKSQMIAAFHPGS